MNLTLNLSLFQTLTWTGTADAPIDGRVATPAYRPIARGEPFRVLIVHTDDNDAEILRPLLERKGFGIYEARSGREALELAGRLRPDIVIIRITAHCGGSHTVQSLRSLFGMRDLPVIITAALGDLAALEGCLAAGASDFVLTPGEWPELYMRMQFHLSRARPRTSAAIPPVKEVWA